MLWLFGSDHMKNKKKLHLTRDTNLLINDNLDMSYKGRIVSITYCLVYNKRNCNQISQRYNA